MKKLTKSLGFTVKTAPLTAAFIFGVIAVPSAVHADSVTYSDAWGPDEIPFGSTALASLPQFNASLLGGTLDSFSLELVANTDAGQITYTDTSGATTDVELLGVGATVTATAPSAVTLTAVPLQTGNDPDLAPYGSYTVTGNSGTALDISGTDSNPSDFAPYEGSGSFDVNIGAEYAQEVQTTGGSMGGLTHSDGETDGTIYVTYNFTPVPEPSTLALLGLGILPFLRLRRK